MAYFKLWQTTFSPNALKAFES